LTASAGYGRAQRVHEFVQVPYPSVGTLSFVLASGHQGRHVRGETAAWSTHEEGHLSASLGVPYPMAAMLYPHPATLFPRLGVPYLEVAMLQAYPARSRHQRLPGFSPRLARDCPKVHSRRSIHARNSRPAYSAVSCAG
jgi:hypothetical protein